MAIESSDLLPDVHLTKPPEQLRHALPEPRRASSLTFPLYPNASDRQMARQAKPLAEEARPHAVGKLLVVLIRI